MEGSARREVAGDLGQMQVHGRGVDLRRLLLLGLLALWIYRAQSGAGTGEGTRATVLAIGLWDPAVPRMAEAGKPLGIEVRAVATDKVGAAPLFTPGNAPKGESATSVGNQLGEFWGDA